LAVTPRFNLFRRIMVASQAYPVRLRLPPLPEEGEFRSHRLCRKNGAEQ
jgi:hypothetical protein